jgi:hypothetical protein
MMRFLWRAIVPGSTFNVWWWLVWLGFAVFMDWPREMIIYGIIFLLNLYSWDYQRRRAAGLPKDPQC